MTALRRSAAGLLSAAALCLPAIAHAEVPYDGWRGVGSTQPSYAGTDYGRRPIDGSPRAYSPPGLVAPPAPVYRKERWAGFYAGGNIGGGWGTVEPRGLTARDISLSGFAGGAHLGYNVQLGSFVLGAEGDASLLSMDGTRLFTDTGTAGRASLDWTASIRGRVGYAFDNLMIYGTAGWALGGLGLDVTSGSFSSSHERVSGLVYGGGVEMKLTPQISGRVEALRYNFDDKSFATSSGNVNVGADATVVRAGISWHFN